MSGVMASPVSYNKTDPRLIKLVPLRKVTLLIMLTHLTIQEDSSLSSSFLLDHENLK